MKRIICGAAAAAVGALLWAATAVAASGGASLSSYNRPGGIQTQVQGAHGVLGTDTNTVGSLPFTGVDLAIIGVVGLFLLALGWSLRRAGRRTA